jgi:hypothetical protein
VQGNGGEKASSGEGGGEGVKLSREIPCKVTEGRRSPVEKDLMKVERA